MKTEPVLADSLWVSVGTGILHVGGLSPGVAAPRWRSRWWESHLAIRLPRFGSSCMSLLASSLWIAVALAGYRL
jgi:hypothetical protein